MVVSPASAQQGPEQKRTTSKKQTEPETYLENQNAPPTNYYILLILLNDFVSTVKLVLTFSIYVHSDPKLVRARRVCVCARVSQRVFQHYSYIASMNHATIHCK